MSGVSAGRSRRFRASGRRRKQRTPGLHLGLIPDARSPSSPRSPHVSAQRVPGGLLPNADPNATSLFMRHEHGTCGWCDQMPRDPVHEYVAVDAVALGHLLGRRACRLYLRR
jgi:hypothetical protein